MNILYTFVPKPASKKRRGFLMKEYRAASALPYRWAFSSLRSMRSSLISPPKC